MLKNLKNGQKAVFKRNRKVLAEADKVLWQNEWARVVEKDGWYTCWESTSGDGIAVIVFNDEKKEVLIRFEHTPCHGVGLRSTSITGSIDENEIPEQTAVRELKEESGIDATPEELISLGWMYPVKFSNYKYYLFAIDGSKKELGEIKGDGTKGEEGAYVKWMPLEAALQINEPTILASLAKLCALGKMKL